MSDTVAVILIAAVWSGAVGMVGLLSIPVLRRTSVRVAFGAVALVAVGGFVAGVLGTAQAMFLNDHDFGVVLLVCAVAGVVSLAFALLLSIPVVRGSRRVRDAARVLGESGGYVAPPHAPTSELQELSRELAEASRRLSEARGREQRMEQARRDLVAWVSHDLRSPLAGIRAMAEALEDGLVEEPDRYYEQIRAEVDRMAALVDDLFLLSRIHAGSLTLELAPVDLADVVSDALAAAEPLARPHDIRVDGVSEPGLVVSADAAQLQRAVGNLLTNAVRHTQAAGSIRITGTSRDGDAVLAVADSCGGIPEDRLPQVFDLAWHQNTARTPSAGNASRTPSPGNAPRTPSLGNAARTPSTGSGTGLGLAIVRGIVTAHGGSVDVRNEGDGCVFELSLTRVG